MTTAIAEDARDTVHVISGQTRDSITPEVSGEVGRVSGDHGTVWEEQRGGEHRFLSKSLYKQRSL